MIRCSATGTLPGRASGVTPGCEAPGTMSPRSLWAGSEAVRERCDCQPQGGRELGLEGMANSGELALSRRKRQQAKEAERLEPKGRWSRRSASSSLLADAAPPAERQSLTPPGVVLVCNVVSPIVSARTRRVVREGVPADEGVGDAGASEGRSVIDRIGVRNLPCPERGLTSGRSWITRKGRKG